jgi:hypothetical protein
VRSPAVEALVGRQQAMVRRCGEAAVAPPRPRAASGRGAGLVGDEGGRKEELRRTGGRRSHASQGGG